MKARGGSILALGGALGAWADIALPWLSVPGPGNAQRSVSWEELVSRGPLPYEFALLYWPLLAWGLCIVAGSAWAWCAYRSRRAPVPPWPWLAVATAGFLLFLTGTRWLGFYVARIWDSGPSRIHLLGVPYLHLAAGLGLLAAALVQARPYLNRGGELGHVWRDSLGVTAILALTLLAMPLLPFASHVASSGTLHYEEATLAISGSSGDTDWSQAAWDQAWIRNAAWAGLALGLALGSMALWKNPPAPARRWLLQALRWSLLVPIAGGLYFATRLLLDVRHIDGATIGPNFFPQIGFLGALTLFLWNTFEELRAKKSGASPP